MLPSCVTLPLRREHPYATFPLVYTRARVLAATVWAPRGPHAGVEDPLPVAPAGGVDELPVEEAAVEPHATVASATTTRAAGRRIDRG